MICVIRRLVRGLLLGAGWLVGESGQHEVQVAPQGFKASSYLD